MRQGRSGRRALSCPERDAVPGARGEGAAKAAVGAAVPALGLGLGRDQVGRR